MRLVTLLKAVTLLLSHAVVLTTCKFTVQPVSVVQAQRIDAVFECRYPEAQNHNWGLNKEFPTENNYPPDVTLTRSSGDTPATLTIPATAHYNNTVVQCEAVVRDGRGFISELSVNASLQVQGPLPAVADLTVNNIARNCSQLNVTWVAPFSLNLTTAEPDIQYCVDVYNIAFKREDNLLQSECNITTTQYLFDVPYPVGTYSFSVTPRSNIDGSLNGITSTGQFSYEPQAIPIDEVNFTTNTELSPLRVTFPESLIHECRAPDSYSIQIQYIDREGFDLCICSTDQTTEVCGNTQMIVLDLNCSSCNIERHRRCNLTVLAEININPQNTPSAMTMNISTHDVYKVTDLTMKENKVSITVDYLPQSTEKGFVAIVYSVDSPYDLHYQVVYGGNTSSTVGNLADRVYKLAVFDLNDVMTPERKLVFPAVVPNTILNNTRYGTTESSAGGEDVNATEFNGKICISCSSSCVGIIHSQYGFDQGNITLIPRTVTDSDQNCTESMPQGIYFAAIFKRWSNTLHEVPYKTVIPIGLPTSTTTADTRTDAHTQATPDVDNTAIVGGVSVAALLILILIVILIVFVCWRWKMQKKRTLVLDTILLENEYDSAPPLNCENVELMLLTRITEPVTCYAATSKPFKQDMDTSSVLSSTLSSPDHVPISDNCDDYNVSTLERSNHDTAPKHSANNRVTQATEASENEQVASVHMEGGTSSVENPIQQPHDQSMESTPKDPVYDVAKQGLAKSSPTPDKNKTEITVVYADLDVNPKADSTPPMQHSVMHGVNDESSLAPRTVEDILHDMILYYFTLGPHSWEDIVQALWEIGEIAVAKKIIRSGKYTVELPVTSPTETPPPLPPRNDTAKAASHQTEAGDDWKDHSVQAGSDTLNTEEHQPVPSRSKHTKPREESTSSETPPSGSMPDKSHDQSVEPAPKDPVYDVVKKHLANSTPTQNNNKTETPVVYADLDVKPKADSTPPMQHPVVYGLIDESSLASRTVENNTPCPLPSLPPRPTTESVLAEYIAIKREPLGEALGIKKHHLDSFSTEGHKLQDIGKDRCDSEKIAVEIKIVRSTASRDINETPTVPDKKEQTVPHNTAMNQKINVHNVSTREHLNSIQVSKIRMSGRQVYPNPRAATLRGITISNSTK
ncbi:uncharacterized protein LOC135330762 isoform X2 [Halichondria panicea]|uniref:uncharacterized protein LOC135330762 isoform X2 n=1 Tax=Halichondria panicea TaxID=6063 RepID=UPI00312BAC89